MTAFNTSFLSSPAFAASRVGKKVSSSSKSNNYLVQVVDFDNEVSTYEVKPRAQARQASKPQTWQCRQVCRSVTAMCIA